MAWEKISSWRSQSQPSRPRPTPRAPPLELRPRSTWRRRRSAEAPAQVACGASHSSHGGPPANSGQRGSGNVWSGADFGGVEAAAEPGRWEDGSRRLAAPGTLRASGLPGLLFFPRLAPLRPSPGPLWPWGRPAPHLGALGRVCPASFYAWGNRGSGRAGIRWILILTKYNISSAYLGPGAVLSTSGAWFQSSLLQPCKGTAGTASERAQPLGAQGQMWTLEICTKCQGIQKKEAVTFELRFGARI